MPTFFSPVTGNGGKSRLGPRGGVTTPFPVKLHNLLESNEFSNVISWQPHGRCFALRKPKEFITNVMPRHFRQTKLTSFQRQLNLYCFVRLTSGRDKGCYYHELFLRGKSSLCERMVRMRIKGTKIKASSSPETEPDFYAMPLAPPRRRREASEINSVQNHETVITTSSTFTSIPRFNNETIPPLPTLSASCIRSESHRSITSILDVAEIESSENEFNSETYFLDPDLCIFEGKGFHFLDSIFSKVDESLEPTSAENISFPFEF